MWLRADILGHLTAKYPGGLLRLQALKNALDSSVKLGLVVNEALTLRLLRVNELAVGDDFKVSGCALVMDELDVGLDTLAGQDLLEEALALPRARPVPSAAAVLQGDCRGGHYASGRGGKKVVRSVETWRRAEEIIMKLKLRDGIWTSHELVCSCASYSYRIFAR